MISTRTAAAFRVFRSWLRAIGVPFSAPLVVEDVKVAMADPDDELEEGYLIIPAALAASPTIPEAMEAFHALTEHLGKGRPVPVDRGAAPNRAEVYGKDAFLSLSRHREFRRAPDLTGERAAFYKGEAKKYARGFVSSNRKLCAAHGHEACDIETYAFMWATIFAHQGEVSSPEDNRRLLWHYFRQRGAALYKFLVKKGRETFPDPAEAYMALTGEALVTTPVCDPWSGPAPEAVAVRDRDDVVALLRQKLAALPHDDMVKALTNESTNQDRDYATQQRALRLLREHQRSCGSCVAPVSVIRRRHGRGADQGRQEDVGRPDERGRAEALKDAGEGHLAQVAVEAVGGHELADFEV